MSAPEIFPKLGCGVGLRPKHYPIITSDWPKVDWFEAISENYMDSGGKPVAILEKIRERYPIGLHGVALSIGSTDPLNQNYLHRLKDLVERIDPAIVSDHLCWSGTGGDQLHDLLPLPFTPEAVRHVVQRVCEVQDFLKRPILLENVSTYVTYQHSVMPEWEFLAEVAKLAGCGILLDLNNIYVNSVNHGFDPITYLDNIPGDRVGQFHVAGHTDMGAYLFDTHSAQAIEPVWDLYREALKRWGQISTLFEWDENIPAFATLMKERNKAKAIYDEYEKHHPQIPSSANYVSKYYNVPQTGQKTLKEVQEWMKAFIQPVGKKPAGETILNTQGGDPGQKRMEVYAEGYVVRLYEGMSQIYETVHALIGHDEFMQLAEKYAARYPSKDYNLNKAGIHFPDLLRENPVKAMPYLEDLARLEWQISEAFHAFDKPPFDRKQLESIPLEDWEHARLTFQPSVSLVTSEWPIMDIWQTREKINQDICVKKNRQYVLVGRKGLQARCEALNDKQYRMLEGLFCGRTLGEVCEELAMMPGNENLPVAQWFSAWVGDELIQRCDIAKDSTGNPALKS